MTVIRGQKVTEIYKDRSLGATPFCFFGENLNSTYASVHAFVRTALDDQGNLWIGFDTLHLYCPSLVGTEFPMIWACNKDLFVYDPYATGTYYQFISSGYYWGPVMYTSNPSYPSGDTFDWYFQNEYPNDVSSTIPVGVDVNMADYGMHLAGKLEDVAYFVRRETPEGIVTEGWTYIAGTYVPDQQITDPGYAYAIPVQLEGIEEWLDYFPWAIRKTNNNVSTWESCNRVPAGLQIRKSGSWRDAKNKDDASDPANTVHQYNTDFIHSLTVDGMSVQDLSLIHI